MIEGKDYNITDNRFIEIEVQQTDSVELLIDIRDENTIHLSFLDFILRLLDSDSSVSRLKCSYGFDVATTSDCCNITVNDLISDGENNIRFESVAAYSENAVIKSSDYILSDIKSIKTKHTLLQMLVLSALPLTLISIILCLIKFSWGLLLASLLLIIFAVIPSLKRIKSFNEECTAENARKALLNAELRQKKGIPQFDIKI